MANTKSAAKAARQATRRKAVNVARASGLRSELKKVESAIASGDKSAAQAAFKTAQPLIMRGASKGAIHRNAMSRKLSRLSKRIKAL
jgi:small subunit ribosomal protein S20